MPLCCETSLVANNHWDQLYIEQVLQLTSHHRWTQFALLGYQVTLVALCQHLTWHKGSSLFSPPVSMLLLLSNAYVPQFHSALHVVIVVWDLDFLPSIHFLRAVPPKKLSPHFQAAEGGCWLHLHSTVTWDIRKTGALSSELSPACFLVTIGWVCVPALFTMLDEGLRTALEVDEGQGWLFKCQELCNVS